MIVPFNRGADSETVRLPDGTEAGATQVVYARPGVWLGLWRCEPKSWSAEFDVDEVMMVQSGEIRFTAVGGEESTFTAGDAVTFERGTRGTVSIGSGFAAWVLVREHD